MNIHPRAGKKTNHNDLINIPRLISFYYTKSFSDTNDGLRVSFGTSGHRGSSIKNTFNEPHVLAITQAICDFRRQKKISGPLFLGMDTHALSEPAHITAIEVLAANNVDVIYHRNFAYTPTPVISHAILNYNKMHDKQADGIVITPSHNPPEDGGFKYNPPTGGPASSEITKWIENQANLYIKNNLKGIKRIPLNRALFFANIKDKDLMTNYIEELNQIIDMDIISKSKIKIGADPLGGSGIYFWEKIAEMYKLNLEVVNPIVDPTFSFMTLDKDGRIRMDCSSKYAMNSLISLKDKFDVAFGNDPDFDRHGIVTKAGLLNPNHYLALSIYYLFQNRPNWDFNLNIGKTLVSSSLIDRVAKVINRKVIEVPVGFKWFVDSLLQNEIGFAGEESAGATFVRKNGTIWTTDKDGIIMNLLSAEIIAKQGKDLPEILSEITSKTALPYYSRIDAPANSQQKKKLSQIDANSFSIDNLAGEKITKILTHAEGNNAPIGGIKVSTQNGWFAARPSGTEEIYKIYAESFINEEHLQNIFDEAQKIIDNIFNSE